MSFQATNQSSLTVERTLKEGDKIKKMEVTVFTADLPSHKVGVKSIIARDDGLGNEEIEYEAGFAQPHIALAKEAQQPRQRTHNKALGKKLEKQIEKELIREIEQEIVHDFEEQIRQQQELNKLEKEINQAIETQMKEEEKEEVIALEEQERLRRITEEEMQPDVLRHMVKDNWMHQIQKAEESDEQKLHKKAEKLYEKIEMAIDERWRELEEQEMQEFKKHQQELEQKKQQPKQSAEDSEYEQQRRSREDLELVKHLEEEERAWRGEERLCEPRLGGSNLLKRIFYLEEKEEKDKIRKEDFEVLSHLEEAERKRRMDEGSYEPKMGGRNLLKQIYFLEDQEQCKLERSKDIELVNKLEEEERKRRIEECYVDNTVSDEDKKKSWDLVKEQEETERERRIRDTDQFMINNFQEFSRSIIGQVGDNVNFRRATHGDKRARHQVIQQAIEKHKQQEIETTGDVKAEIAKLQAEIAQEESKHLHKFKRQQTIPRHSHHNAKN